MPTTDIRIYTKHMLFFSEEISLVVGVRQTTIIIHMGPVLGMIQIQNTHTLGCEVLKGIPKNVHGNP